MLTYAVKVHLLFVLENESIHAGQDASLFLYIKRMFAHSCTNAVITMQKVFVLSLSCEFSITMICTIKLRPQPIAVR